MGCFHSARRCTEDNSYRGRTLWRDLINQEPGGSEGERVGCHLYKSGWDIETVDSAGCVLLPNLPDNADEADLLEPKPLVYEKKKEEESGMTAEEEAELAELMSDDVSPVE